MEPEWELVDGLEIEDNDYDLVVEYGRSPPTSIMDHADLLPHRLERAEPPTQTWLRTHVGALGAGARRMASIGGGDHGRGAPAMGKRLALQVAPVKLGALVEGMARTLEASASGKSA